MTTAIRPQSADVTKTDKEDEEMDELGEEGAEELEEHGLKKHVYLPY